jgi:hypothetical protein
MSDVTAILDLLGDPDPVVHDALVGRLGRDRGLLDRTWLAAQDRGGDPHEDLIDLVLTADAEDLVDAFAAVEDLEGGAWILPRLNRPRTDYRTEGVATLDALADRLRERSVAPTGGSVAAFLCDECGFAGDRERYHDPANSYLPAVLDRRLGLPIALTTLWILVGRRLGLQLEAIAAPGHVVGRWHLGKEPIYVDLFAGGQRIGLETLEARVRAAGEASVLPYLAPASDRALLRRMARNLVAAYAQRGDRVRATIAHGLASA